MLVIGGGVYLVFHMMVSTLIPQPVTDFISHLHGWKDENWEINGNQTLIVLKVNFRFTGSLGENECSDPNIENSDLKLVEELEAKRADVEALKASSQVVTPSVGQHDRELVEDHLTTINKKLLTAQEKAQRQLQTCQSLIVNYNSVTEDIDGFVEWMKSSQNTVTRQPAMGFNVAQAQEILQQHNDLLADIEQKKVELELVQKQANTSLQALGSRDQELLDKRIQDLSSQHRQLREVATERRKQLSKEVSARQGIQGDLDKVTTWLEDKEVVMQGGMLLPLHSKDITRELETKKTLLGEVRNFGNTVERFLTEGGRIMQHTDDGDRQTMEDKLSNIRERYDTLKTYLESYVHQAQKAHVSHKQLEADMLKVELWVKEVDQVLAKPIQLDCSTEMLREQVKKYQNLANSTRLQETITEDITTKSDAVLPNLRDADSMALKERLSTLRDSMNRVSNELSARQASLEEALTSKSHFEEELLELTRVLCVTQEQLKQISRSVGHQVSDARDMLTKAQKLEDSCGDLQPRVTNLQTSMEQLRAMGHPRAAEEMNHLTRMYGEIQSQAALQIDKLGKAVTLREQYHAQKGEVEMLLKECQEQMEAVEVLGVAVHTKLDRYKSVYETLQAKQPELSFLGDRAQQIGIEGTPNDVEVLQNQTKHIETKTEQLKNDAQRKGDRLQNILAERQGFEVDLDKIIEFLNQKESQLRPHEQLGMDVDGVEAELRKLHVIKEDVNANLQGIQEQIDEQKAKYDDLDEVIPLEVKEKVDNLEAIRDKILDKIRSEEDKLTQAKLARSEFRSIWQEVSDWVKGADDGIKSDDEGVNYETAEGQLKKHRATFAVEKDIEKKMDKLLDLSEKLKPSLDMNDKATMMESINNLNKKVSDVTAAADHREKELQETLVTWNLHQERLTAVQDYLDEVETTWQTLPDRAVVSLEQARGQLHDAQEYLSGLNDHQNLITQLSSLTQQMERQGSVSSQTLVDDILTKVQEKYRSLKGKAEEKQANLQETVENWDMYQERADALRSVLTAAQSQVPPENLERSSSADLQQQLIDSKSLLSTVEGSQSELTALQRAAQSVLAQLPASETKMAIQLDLINIQDQYEQLQWKAREQQRALETEVADRDKLTVELADSMEFLSETETQLKQDDTMGLSVEDVEDKINQQQVLKQDLGLRMARVQHEIRQQQDKYGDDVSAFPEEVKARVRELLDTQQQIAVEMENREQTLAEAKTARQDYHTNLGVVRSWLNDAEAHLNKPVTTTEQDIARHEALVSEISLFEPKLQHLQSLTQEISFTTSIEDQELLHTTITDLTQRWQTLKEKTQQRSEQLSETADLQQRFDEEYRRIMEWTDLAQTSNSASLEWGSHKEAQGHIDQHRNIVQDGETLEARFQTLEDLASQLGKSTSPEELTNKMISLREQFITTQTDSKKHLADMEETFGEWDECQKEVEKITQWMSQAKASLLVPDASLTIQEQLEKQELILKEIDKHEQAMSQVLSKHEKLRSYSGRQSPTEGIKVKQEIEKLKAEAQERKQSLQAHLEEQQQHQQEVDRMSASIEEARGKVEGSIQKAESVDALKEKIKDAHTLQEQIRTWEIEIIQLNEKTLSLAEKAAHIREQDAAFPDSGDSPDKVMSILASLKKSEYGFNENERSTSPLSVQTDDTDNLLENISFKFEDLRESEDNLSLVIVEEQKSTNLQGQESKISSFSEINHFIDGQDPDSASLCSLDEASTLQTFETFHPGCNYSDSKRDEIDLTTSMKYSGHPRENILQHLTSNRENIIQYLTSNIAESQLLKKSPCLSPSDSDVTRKHKSSTNSSHKSTQIYSKKTEAGERQQQLERALQDQERLHVATQDITKRLEETEQRLARTDPAKMGDAENKLRENQDVLLELELLDADIRNVTEQCEQMTRDGADPEEQKAIQATLRLLHDKYSTLSTLAQDQEQQLQESASQRKNHNKAFARFQSHLNEYENWLTSARVAHAGDPMTSYDVAYLRQQVRENQNMQAELNERLQQMSDMSVECEHFAEFETAESYEIVRLGLRKLHDDTKQFKQDMLNKLEKLKVALKESEKKKKELDEYKQSVDNLQKWLEESKKGSLTSPESLEASAKITEEQKQLQQKLEQDIADHRQLIQSVSRTVKDVVRSRPRGDGASVASDDESSQLTTEAIQDKWKQLSRQLSQKKTQLQDSIDRSQPGEFFGLPLQAFRPHYYGQPQDASGSTHLGEVRRSLTELNACWEKLQSQVDDKQARLEHTLHFQQLYQEALLNISAWLDDIENRMFAVKPDLSTEQRLRENEILQKELEDLQSELAQMNQASQQLMLDASSESKSLIRQTISDLHERLKTLEGQASDRKEQLQKKDQSLKKYKDDVGDLQCQLTSAQDKYASILASNLPLGEKLAEQKRLEEEIQEYQLRMQKLQADGQTMAGKDPSLMIPKELTKLQDNWQKLQQVATEKKTELEKVVLVLEQYKRMLKEYEEYLETAQNKLKGDSHSARDLSHLQQQLTTHTDFFADLESHRTLLDSLAQNLDSATQQLYETTHTRLTNLTHVIQDRASIHGQKLDRLIQDWLSFNDQFSDIKSWLGHLEPQLPESESCRTIEELRKMIWDYHTVQKALDDEKAVMYECVDRGHQLLQDVSCPDHDTQLKEFSDKWVKISNKANTELKRLQTILDQWEQFDRDAATLENWLDSACSRANRLAELEHVDTQNLTVLRNKMEHFLDFRKEVENQQPLKSKVAALGNQLLRVRPSDSKLQQQVQRIEDQWLSLVAELPNNEEQLHQAQMELLPSRQALSELILWLETMETTIQEDTGKVLLSLVDCQVMLQKYRSLKVDITNRQLTVDFVNQSSSQMVPLDLNSSVNSSVLNEKTEFDERLGQMNNRYQAVSSDVIERLKNLDMLEIRWQEFEKTYNNIVNWLTDQEARVEKYSKIGHEASIQQAIKDCQALQYSIQTKDKEIDDLKQLGLSLVESHHGQPSTEGVLVIEGMMTELSDSWAALDNQTHGVVDKLQDALRQWSLYSSALQRCNQLLTETEYSFNRYNVASGDINGFKALINRLKTLQAEFEVSSARLQQLSETAAQLLKICEVPASQAIQKTVEDSKNRWERFSSVLVTRIASFEDLYDNWAKYESEFEDIYVWLTGKEKEIQDLLYRCEGREEPPQLIEEAKKQQGEVNVFSQNLVKLSHLSDQLTHHMDSATVIHLTTRETMMGQRLHALQQALSHVIHNLHGNLTKHTHFQDTFDTLDNFLSDADNVLRVSDPNKSAEEDLLKDRIVQLKDLTAKFSRTQPDFESLNLTGYRLPLSDDDSTRLRSLNQKWYNLSSDTAERFRAMQGHLLLQQDFSEKCEEWMRLLTQVEADLAAPIAGSFEGLQKQQTAHEIFQNEIYSRQQILHSIISEGHQMIREGDVDDREDFEQKLSDLEAQWQSVLRRSQQRRSIIDSLIRQWQTHNDERDQLDKRMQLVADSLKDIHIQGAPIQKMRSIHTNIKKSTGSSGGYSVDRCYHELGNIHGWNFSWFQSSQLETTQLEPLYLSVIGAGKVLIQSTDATSREIVQKDLDNLQARWIDIINQLDTKRAEVEGVLTDWDDTEQCMEDMLEWLKETRGALIHDLSENYDDLQRELHQCMEFESSFKGCADRKLRLSQKQQDLACHVSSQDVSILQQRLLLLNKQWDELLNQVELRHQRISDRLARWGTFNEKYRDLSDAMTHMDSKISAGKEYHIEDFLHKLEHDYKEEMMSLDRERERLVHDGQRLIHASSEIRANDIEYKLSKINDKWSRLKDKAIARQKKLKETLSVVQQLEQNMRRLRQWLAHIEHELGSPVVYKTADFSEIQNQLELQQELQRDIQKHSTGVASVVNLCEVLLHDTDACPTPVEQAAIQSAILSLDKRWKNICNLSMDRRQSIEETWKLWQKYHDDYQRFTDWLREAERLTANPRTEHSSLAAFKDELRKYETFQKTLHEKLSQLENLNKQYRHLARDGRTDTGDTLKHQIKEANQRWDELSKKSQIVLRRLRHMINMRDDFTATREALLVWMTEINSRVTRLEHFSQGSATVKIQEIQSIRGEIENNSSRLEYIDEAADYLIKKCESHDAVQIQADLDEFRQVVENVITRLNKYETKLQRISTGEDSDDSDFEYKEAIPDIEQIEKLVEDMEDLPPGGSPPSDFSSDSEYEDSPTVPAPVTKTTSSSQDLSPGSRPIAGHKPGKGPSGPPRPGDPYASLDWDMYDMENDSDSEINPNEWSSTRPSRSMDTPVGWDTQDGDRWQELREHVDVRGCKLQRVEGYLRELEQALEGISDHLRTSETRLRAPTPVGPDADTSTGCYTTMISSCENRVGNLRKLEQELKQETGLPSLYGAEKQIRGVVKRFYTLQHKAIEKDHRLESHRRQWLQWRTDLQGLASWLDSAERTQLRQVNPPSDITQLEVAVKRHREFMLEVGTRRPIVVSLNVLSKDLLSRGARESRDLYDRLSTLNQRWDRVCARGAVWQKELQIALVQCQDFNKTLDDLFVWLQSIESDIRHQEPVDFTHSRDRLIAKYSKFRDLRFDLEAGQDKVLSLHDTCDGLLVDSDSADSASAKERLHIVASQLESLLKICQTYMTRIENVISIDKDLLHRPSVLHPPLNGNTSRPLFHTSSALSPRSPRSYFSRQLVALAPAGTFSVDPDQDIDETIESEAGVPVVTRRQPSSLLSRVWRMALPIQGLMLLLLGVASLVPMTEDDFSCTLANNFRRSLDPMLQYTEGPPPF